MIWVYKGLKDSRYFYVGIIIVPHTKISRIFHTHISLSGEVGMGSKRASCLLMSGERGCNLWGRRGDSRRAWPIPESSESMLTSDSEQEG